MVTVVPKERLATHVPMVGWSVTMYVLAKGTDNANITWIWTAVCHSLVGVFRINSAILVIVVPKEHHAIHVLSVSKSVTMFAQAKAIDNASGQMQTTHPGGASLQTRAQLGIAVRKELLAIHVHLVGWSTMINVLGGETASVGGAEVKMSLDGVFHMNRAMLAIVVRKAHLATRAPMVGW